jgi:predicted MFS family arabinose efflux permease
MAFSGLILIHLVSAWSPGYIILLVARGLGSLMIMSSLAVIVLMQNQWFLPAQIGTVKGIETGLVSLGQMVTLAGLPFLMANLSGWRGTYTLAGVALIPVLVGWVLFAKEKRTPDYQSRTAEQPEASSPIISVLKRKDFVLLGIGSAGASIAYVAIMNFWPTYATQVRGFGLEIAGPILSLVAVGSMIASFLTGALSDKIGLRKPIPIIAGMLMPAAYFAMLKFSSIAALGVSAFLIGFGACVSVPIILAIPFEIKGITPREIAVGIGFITALTNIGAALGSQLTGILIGGLGLYATLAAVCLSPLVLSVCISLCAETGPKAKTRDSLAILRKQRST